MPRFSMLAALAAAAVLAAAGAVRAAPFPSIDVIPAPAPVAMESGETTIAPLPFVKFCMTRSAECQSRGSEETVSLNAETMETLNRVNRSVNASIRPVSKVATGSIESWAIAPAEGDCNDYAVTKRHELIRLGLPSRALLLAAARTRWGEGHLVLVVRTDRGDFVLDNLTSRIRAWNATGYRWLKRQSAENPLYWTTIVAARRPVLVARARTAPPPAKVRPVGPALAMLRGAAS